MDAFLLDWLNLLVRWGHLIVGITWIGTSFYFMELDYKLLRHPGGAAGLAGTAWEVHGGGFYRVEKYLVAPPGLPDDLIWHRWAAYLTFLSGLGLLLLQYYLNARTYLIDPSVMPLAPWQAVAISLASLLAGWLLYDGLCRSPLGGNTPLLAGMVFGLILLAAAGYGQVFSGRGALLHVGAFIGTIMAANVFRIIVPNQKKIVAALLAGEAPDPKYGKIGKQRSTHNNYLTLPVLLMMVSNHYGFLAGHRHGWLVVAMIVIGGGAIRHVINRHDAGDPPRTFIWGLPAAGLALLAAVVVTAPRQTATGPVALVRALQITRTHCVDCHAAAPRREGFSEAPKGVKLETADDLARWSQAIITQAVTGAIMPLGNETGMTDQERGELGAYLRGLR